MEGDHVDTGVKTNSIFSLFSDLTGEKNENPKYCWKLIKNLRENEFTVGSGSNLEYSIKRLVRGLGSTRLHAQCGCFAALTCALKYQVCSVESVLEALEKEQKPPQGATKSEMRALSTNCVLTCGAIIQSGLFSTLSSDVQETILKKLIEAGKKKSYLLSVIIHFLVDVITKYDNEVFKSVAWPICKSEIFQNLTECGLDGYYLLLVCLKKNFKIVNKYLQKNSTSPDLLVENILKSLLNSSTKYDHPIYNDLGEFFCNNATQPIKLWSKCVNENAKVNPHKDTVLISVFYYIVKNLNEATIIPKLLVPRFLEIIIKVLSMKTVDNCEIAKSALDSLIKQLCGEGTSDETRFQTIKKLIFYPANLKFEIKTGTKCIYTLVSKLSCEFTKKLADVYKQIINGEVSKKIDEDGTEEPWNNKEKQQALHTLTKTLNHPSVKKEIFWRLNEIKYLFELAFLKKLPSEEQKCARDCFYKAVMMQMPSLKELILFLDDLAEYINGFIKNKELNMGEDVEKYWGEMYTVVESLKKKLNNKLYSAFHVFFVYIGLYLFVDFDLAKGGIEELLSCYQHLKEKKKKKDLPHWTEVTVDLILSLLSRENRLWRHVVACVFPQVVSQMTPTALQQIVDALDPKSQDSVLGNIDSEEESDEESESESDSKSESSLSEGDEGKPNDQLRMAVRNALGYSAAQTDDESVDMDQMDEEEEKRLNESLSEAFRQYKAKSQKKKKQSKEEEALTHFRLRVLDLIEIYINSPSMAGCLDLLLPLFDLLELSIKDHYQRPLQNRVDSILKHISTVKTFTSTETVTQEIIKEVFESVISRKETSSLVFVEMSPRISDCTAFLVRCSQQIPNEGDIPLVEQYNSLLQSFFQSRDPKLPISMFQAVLRMSWLGNFQLVSSLFNLLTSPTVRIFKKVKIIELLRIFYKNDKLHSTSGVTFKGELNKIEKNFISNFTQVLSEYPKNEPKLSEKIHLSFFSNIINLIKIIQSSFKKHRSNFNNPPLWKNLVSKMTETDIIINNKKTRAQLGNLANIFQIELPPKDSTKNKKRTISESSVEEKEETEEQEQQEEEEIEKKKKKRKMTAEIRKLKKESRALREEMSSEGLTMVKFSKIDSQSLPEPEFEEEDDEDEEEEKPIVKKRRKESI